MSDFLHPACICGTCGAGSQIETKERKMSEENRNESPSWWPITGCWESNEEQRSTSQAEK